MSVHISYGNQKLSAAIPSINLPPESTCRADAPCAKGCYAKHGRFKFSNVKNTLSENWEIWKNNPALYENTVMKAAASAKYFRWHSSGDIPDTDYLAMMCRIAEKLPGTQFLCFTKKYELVNGYRKEAKIPKNLHILLSAWGEWLPDNPYKLPVAYVRLKSGNGVSRIPADALECPGFCATCILQNQHCWNLKNGESVVFNQH